jgi:HAD superfamily hydrolase (TIGR01549 family)
MKAILFDWDGTLVDTLDSLYEANAAVMRAFGVAFDAELYRRHYTPNWREMYRRLGIEAERLDEANELWMTAYDQGAGAILFPGVDRALRRLAQGGYALGLVTAGDRAVVDAQIERLGLGDLLTVRVFGDDLPVHKPDPRPLRHALDQLGLLERPAEATYVGDAPDDMRMARTVGAAGVGIASSLGEPDALRAAGAVEVASSVPAWVDGLLADRTAA